MYRIDEYANMFRRGELRHAVTEIEYVITALAIRVEHALRVMPYSFGACK